MSAIRREIADCVVHGMTGNPLRDAPFASGESAICVWLRVQTMNAGFGRNMEYKRITLLSGHYGSGKTNIAVNLALDMRRRDASLPLAVADLDIVNPYFRTLDSKAELEAAGIDLIVSRYANTNLDAPALPSEMYRIIEERNRGFVVDVGGDDRGALALGRLSGKILEEGMYDMLLVINCYRPLSRDAESTVEILREIEEAARLPFTGIVNNSNLGSDTTAETIISSLDYAREVSGIAELPVVLTTIDENVYNKYRSTLQERIENIFPLRLQARPV